MIFVLIFAATMIAALTHVLVERRKGFGAGRLPEIFLLYLLAGNWGVGGVLTSLPHIVIPDVVAGYIGWETGSPFQIELGFAALGLAILGVMCIWIRGWFWLAPAVAQSVFLLGAAYVHVSEIVTENNLSAGNAGPVLFFDLAVPLVVWCLLAWYIRAGGLRRAA